MQDMIGTYRCLKPFSFPSPSHQPRTDYMSDLPYYVRPGNEPLAELMRTWVAEGKFEKISDAEPAAAMTGTARVVKKG